MGIFDGGDIDPLTGGLLGATSAYAQGLGPSQLPINPLQSILGAIGGFGQGYEGTQLGNAKTKLLAQEAEKNQLANAQLISRMNYMAMRHPEMFPGGVAGLLGQAGYNGAGSPVAGAVGGGSGGGVPMGQGGAQGAPAASAGGVAGTAAAGAPSGGGLFDPETEGKIIDAQYLGIPNDVIAKQVPGPTATMQALRDAGIDPKSPQGQQMLALAAQNATGVKPYIGGERPGVPLSRYNPATGKYDMESYVPTPIPGSNLVPLGNGTYGFQRAPGADFNMGANAGIEQGAILGREEALKRFTAQQEFGTLLRGNPGAASAAGQRGFNVGGPSAPAASAPAGATEQPAQLPSGRAMPPLTEQVLPSGTVALGHAVPAWQKVSDEWAAARPSGIVGEQRALAIAEALKLTESGEGATGFAKAKAVLHAAGIDLPEDVWGNPAQVQTALKDNFASTLSTIRAFTSRPAAAEVILGQKNFANPDLQPEANLNIISQQVGTLRWERAMMDDFQNSKARGWSDPQQFQTAWTKAHPLQDFIDQAKTEIGPLKGMPGGPGSPAAWAPPKGKEADAAKIKDAYDKGLYTREQARAKLQGLQ